MNKVRQQREEEAATDTAQRMNDETMGGKINNKNNIVNERENERKMTKLGKSIVLSWKIYIYYSRC